MDKPTKHQIDYALKVTRTCDDAFNITKAARYFAEHYYGIIHDGKHHVDRKAKKDLKVWLKSHGIDWMNYDVSDKSRIGISSQQINEKLGADQIKKTWVKIKSLDGDNMINETPLLVPALSHIEMSKDDIYSIDTDALVLIENLEPFKVVGGLKIKGIPKHAIAVYRGDNQSGMVYTWIKSVIKDSSSIQLILFADFDPAGIDIALGAQPMGIVLPCLQALQNVQGSKEDYSNQLHQLRQRIDSANIPLPLKPWTDYLLQMKEGYTQERLISENVPLMVVWLFEGSSND